MLRITHNAGFYSCCTIRLEEILEYFNTFKKLPEIVDSSAQFAFYKTHYNQNLSLEYFKTDPNINITFTKNIASTTSNQEQQFSDYSMICFNDLEPFIKKYFMSSDSIVKNIQNLVTTYNIDFNNTCAVRYRGNDKGRETVLASYGEIAAKARIIQNKNSNIKFLVLTDEKEFLEYFKTQFEGQTIHFDELATMNSNSNTSPENLLGSLHGIDKAQSAGLYSAAIQILSKCKYIITTSGNGEFWMMLYRGHNKNVLQFLNKEWLSTIE